MSVGTFKCQLNTTLSARNLYKTLIELKDYLLDQLKPIGADGVARDTSVRTLAQLRLGLRVVGGFLVGGT